MKNFVIGFIAAWIVMAAGAYIFFRFGFAPVATSARPLPFEAAFAEMALNAEAAKGSRLEAPLPADEPNLLAGAHIYRDNCAFCHGLSSPPETMASKGMFPHPPQLLAGDKMTDDPVGATYWTAANGIRLSGMPGFKGSLSDTQLWQVSQLIRNADKLPAAVKAVVSEAPAK